MMLEQLDIQMGGIPPKPFDPYLTTIYKNKLWIIDLNVKDKNIRKKILWPYGRQKFYRQDTKAQAIKEKNRWISLYENLKK